MPVLVLRLLDNSDSIKNRPNHCPYCGSEAFQRWGAVTKKVHGANEENVEVFRFHCNKCGHTFRNYPQGIDRTNLTERVRKLAGLVWALGLSCRETVTVFKELGIEMSSMTIWREGNDLVQKYFHDSHLHLPPQYKLDKLFLKYRGKGIGTIVILDIGMDKKVVLGRVNEPDPQVFLCWLNPIIQDLQMQASLFGTGILDQYNIALDEPLS